MLRLYHMPVCPFSRKVRLAAREKSLTLDLVEVQPWAADAPLGELNPAGEVPVLVDDDLVVCDSQAITDFFEDAYPDHTLLGRTLAERNETRRLVAWFDGKFNREVTDLLWREKLIKRLKRSGTPNSDAVRTGMTNIRQHLDYIGYLFEQRTFLAGDEMTLADLAAAAHLSVLDYMGDVPWTGFDGAREWYAKIKSRPSFRPLLLDRIVGVKPPEHYDDLDF